jgi:hypothetical protein
MIIENAVLFAERKHNLYYIFGERFQGEEKDRKKVLKNLHNFSILNILEL